MPGSSSTSSAVTIALASGKRSAGTFARHRETTFSSTPSIYPVNVESGGDVSRVMAARSSPAVVPVNGRLPASIS